MPNFRHIVDLAYQQILKRPADPSGADTYNALMNGGLTEERLRESLLRSKEFADKFPPEGGGPPPDPPPVPPGGAITSLSLGEDRRCLLLNGRPWTIASHGNVVPAITSPDRNWRTDIALQAEKGESYARLWHILAGRPMEWPWLKLGGKFDLTRPNAIYWDLMKDIMSECDRVGVVLEVMLFDRGCGGSHQDYKEYPWYPANNVNNLGDELPLTGPGFPEFYALKPKTKALQEEYVQRWVQAARPFPGVILEIDNESRSTSFAFTKHFAGYIKFLHPSRLVSCSFLDIDDLEPAYVSSEIDIACPHFGNDGNDPRRLHQYMVDHWKKGKLVNIDEFANGLGDKALLREMCETITKNGGHFHIEDSLPQADGYGAAAYCRSLAASANPPFCDIGPTGPMPPCPKETKRGWSMLYINDKNNQRVFTGNTACTKAAAAGQVRVGYVIAFDSTALVGTQEPVPDGCGTCVENPTVWTHTSGIGKQDGPCGFEIKLTQAGLLTVTARPKSGPGAAVTKSIKVVS